MSTNTELYAQDLYAWCLTTAALIRDGKWHNVDLAAVAEEIETVGRSQKRELESRLHVLVMHLLKWRYQPTHRESGHSGRSAIRTQRRELHLLLRDNPSLRPQVPSILADSYPAACEEASDETALPEATFPPGCPWTPEQILDTAFWPEE